MADNWWDSSSSRTSRPANSNLDSAVSTAATSINLFQDTDATNTKTTTATGTGGSLQADPSLQMMGLGLSSHTHTHTHTGPHVHSLDWNQALFRADQKTDENSFRNLLQEDQSLSSNTATGGGNLLQLENNQWRPPHHKIMYSQDHSSNSDFKQINVRGFQLDQYGDHIITCQGLNSSSFQNMESSSSYGNPSTIIQTLFGSDNSSNQQDSAGNFDRGMTTFSSTCSYQPIASYGGVSGELLQQPQPQPQPQPAGNWSQHKYPQEFSVNSSPPKVQLQLPNNIIGNQLHFSNNARFWNAPAAASAAAAAAMNDVRSRFFPSLQMQLPTSTSNLDHDHDHDHKPKITSEVVKKSSSESSSTKRPRSENQSPLPAFKANTVRKEKMGDRITALQQLVSPFGKTDTASVLSEAIEYIKFLHEQVSVLSTPYMKSEAHIMQQQQQQQQQYSGGDESSEVGGRQDLRSRGLCLVPVSSTFPVTHETTVDFWTPTFGGTYR